MQDVELIRTRVVRGLSNEFQRIRIFLSMTEGNAAVCDRLQGDHNDRLLAEVAEKIMRHLGHDPSKFNRRGGELADPSESTSTARRLIARAKKGG